MVPLRLTRKRPFYVRVQDKPTHKVNSWHRSFSSTVVPGFSVLGFRALPGFRELCTGNQIWISVINLPGFSALPGFKAPFYGDTQSALNPGTTVFLWAVWDVSCPDEAFCFN